MRLREMSFLYNSCYVVIILAEASNKNAIHNTTLTRQLLQYKNKSIYDTIFK